MKDCVAELWCGGEELCSFGWVGHAEILHLAEDVEKLCRWNGVECPADGVGCGHAWIEWCTWRQWRQRIALLLCRHRRHPVQRTSSTHVHREMCWWWCPPTPSISTMPCTIPLPTRVIVAVIDLQLPPHNLKAIQIPHCRRCSVHIAILEEAEALGFPGLLVVDQAEVEDSTNTAEDVADLLFADAVRDVADEDYAPTFLAGCHRVRVKDVRSSVVVRALQL